MIENQNFKNLEYDIYKAKYNIYNLKEVINLCEDKLDYIENIFINQKKNKVLRIYKKIFVKYQNKLKNNKINTDKSNIKLSKKWISKYKKRTKIFNESKKIYYKELENIKNIHNSLIKIINNMINENLKHEEYITSYESVVLLNCIIDLKFIHIYKSFFKGKFIFEYFSKSKKIFNLIGEIEYSKKMFFNNSGKIIIISFFLLTAIVHILNKIFNWGLNYDQGYYLVFLYIIVIVIIFILGFIPFYFAIYPNIVELIIQAKINKLRKIIDKYSFVHKTNKSKGYFSDIWNSILKKHKR